MTATLLSLAQALSLDSLSKAEVGKCQSGCCRFYAIGKKSEDIVVVQLEAKIDYATLLPRFVVNCYNDENYDSEGSCELYADSAATPEFAEMWNAITMRVKAEQEEDRKKVLEKLRNDPAISLFAELLGASFR